MGLRGGGLVWCRMILEFYLSLWISLLNGFAGVDGGGGLDGGRVDGDSFFLCKKESKGRKERKMG